MKEKLKNISRREFIKQSFRYSVAGILLYIFGFNFKKILFNLNCPNTKQNINKDICNKCDKKFSCSMKYE